MEFKGNYPVGRQRGYGRRYRNRVEFKVMVERAALILSWVDIETEWNLKRAWKTNGVRNADVDIETEWNLKQVQEVCHGRRL